MNDETRLAVLIDAENISPKYIQVIFDEVSNYGVSTYRRIYGDWTSTRNNRWKEVLLDNSITPIQQYSYTEGKNSSDSAMIIDAMDILYTLSVDGYVLVSSDSDFTRLASRLRESGMTVIGMGESKTPNAFISACNTFKYLDILFASLANAEEEEENHEDSKTAKSKSGRSAASAQEHAATSSKSEEKAAAAENGSMTPAKGATVLTRKEWKKDHAQATTAKRNGKREVPRPQTTILSVRKALRSIVRENSDEEDWISLANLGNQLSKRFPDFDVRNYGHQKLVTFIESFHEFEVAHRPVSEFGDKQLFVRLRKK
ncbi:NYN domain-containing protein [Murdochiella vaginalis]|uniref:NYN domain-containing protein n=1 Tax=Murdochiella vaginalis TaxID=1852373 RepID=UPI0008FE7A12|nr:NYN domain-containing protein [Murdochiella vaginalis]